MEKIQRQRMLWRIPLVTAIFFAIFWGAWYVGFGKVPMDNGWILNWKISLSRFWDVLFAPIWALILILLHTGKKNGKIEKLSEDHGFWRTILGTGLFLGLLVGLGFSVARGCGYGLLAGLAAFITVAIGSTVIAGLYSAFDCIFTLVENMVTRFRKAILYLFQKLNKNLFQKIRSAAIQWLSGK